MLTHMHKVVNICWCWHISDVFVEMKCLFSFASKDGTEGKVTQVIIAVFRVIDTGCGGVRRRCHVWCLALGDTRWSQV
jgi:hypothetical protein